MGMAFSLHLKEFRQETGEGGLHPSRRPGQADISPTISSNSRSQRKRGECESRGQKRKRIHLIGPIVLTWDGTHLAPYTVITVSLTVFPMLYFTSLWLVFRTGFEVSGLTFNI